MTYLGVENFVKNLRGENRTYLAKAITLIESEHPDHQKIAELLINQVLPSAGKSIRIAVSGPPGVGKSSFIEKLGLEIIRTGRKIAVLAIDPSSSLTGGSILGDKTRMEELAKSSHCFIRPTPSSGVLGGVAKHTRDSLILCEAAGYEVIIIETVGIGQSELIAASMTDIFIQLHLPCSGDELQAIKKGLMEITDFIVITKADGTLKSAAEHSKSEMKSAFSYNHSNLQPEIFTCSSLSNDGFSEIWLKLLKFVTDSEKNGTFDRRRSDQILDWFNQEIHNELEYLLCKHPNYSKIHAESLDTIRLLQTSPKSAAKKIIETLLSRNT